MPADSSCNSMVVLAPDVAPICISRFCTQLPVTWRICTPVSFDWRRYQRVVGSGNGLTEVARAHLLTGLGQRTHRVRHAQRKVVGLPDEEFEKMLRRAVELWADYLAAGDRRFALEPERQRGALLHRNVAILLCMRYAGARRSEISTIRLDDIDRQRHKLHLQTKGHRKGDVEYLPVVLYPIVAGQLWTYFTDYRPIVSTTADHGQLFVSHAIRDYGQPISDSASREIFDRLRPALSPPWRKQATPHTLRHACAYELQGRVSPDVIMAQMRHRSTRSLDPYRASALAFADQLLTTVSPAVQEMMNRVGLGG